MKKKKKRLITAALPYVNNVPHLGHVVGSHLPADIFARYSRAKGYDTIFIGGTDEHGTPSVLAAEKLNVTPRQLCDYYHRAHKEIYEWFEFSYDNFSRTSRPIHYQTTQEFFEKIYKKGWVIEKEMLLPFCSSCQRFLPDRYIEGICPFCGYESARGDQCENCGRLINPSELKAPECAVCGSQEISFKETNHLFLDLRGLSDNIEDWVKKNSHWRKQVRQLALGWIKEGLRPRSITRDLEWGVPVPLDGYRDKVFYVWFDAPIGYISSTKERFPDRWEGYWKDSESKIYHFVGKDNIPFHTIFWPGSLIAHGDFNLPYNVIGLQYLNYEGRKISKSKKWGVFCENLPQIDLSPDYWRFYLSFLIPETSDTDFKWEEFQERTNQELIGNFGNFIHRTLSMIDKYFDGQIGYQEAKLSSQDKKFIQTVKGYHQEIGGLIEEIELRKALRKIIALASEGNKYFDHQAPWRQVKEDKKEAQKTLFLCSGLAESLAVLVSPYLPSTAEKIWSQLNLVGDPGEEGIWDSVREIKVKGSYNIKKPDILFDKITADQIKGLKEKTSKLKEPEIGHDS